MINATRDQIESHKESILWNDIVTELGGWQEGFDREMNSIVDDSADSNPSTASVLMHIGDLNGRRKAIDYVLNILELFLSLLEDKKDDAGRDQTDGSGDNS